MLRRNILAGLVLTTAAVGATALAPAVASAHEDHGNLERVRVYDDCDPVTFNQVLGPDACVGDGDTTLQSLVDQVQRTGAAKGWEFKPDDVRLDLGQGLRAVSRGGEFHTFTRVAAFGGGCVPDLNRGQAPVPECQDPTVFQTTGLLPGHTLDVTGLGEGRYRYMCLIHPWMKTVVDVQRH